MKTEEFNYAMVIWRESYWDTDFYETLEEMIDEAAIAYEYTDSSPETFYKLSEDQQTYDIIDVTQEFDDACNQKADEARERAKQYPQKPYQIWLTGPDGKTYVWDFGNNLEEAKEKLIGYPAALRPEVRTVINNQWKAI